MFSLTASLTPLLLGGLLLWTGGAKVTSRTLLAQAGLTALPRLVRGPHRAALVLRLTGVAEVALAAGLLALPRATVPAAGTAALGVGFLGYLAAAKAVAPESSCGCTANDTQPVTWRSFARAGAVAAGGAAALAAGDPWWSAAGDSPAAATALLAAGALLLAALSAGPERRVRVVLRRLRLRLFGNPLGGDAGETPVAASVELLERSLAWETAAPLIRSGLIEHWDEDGWRILHYTGARRTGELDRTVSVLFAMDAGAHRDRPAGQAIRVSVVDRETAEVLPLLT
ncbi:MauE/DoxX family redox-associated membrane protein [Streptomyces sp. SBT349]|uniref:MauE/DoxX family redox-associated membrane protein n=1 Tax=Streptomyces sp. SBT349 TaxID=1580539 RepID=UPI00066A1808|nr:MauE/DoxX family redox-associated membrane protein [Streptomyces sp. SBT349]